MRCEWETHLVLINKICQPRRHERLLLSVDKEVVSVLDALLISWCDHHVVDGGYDDFRPSTYYNIK